MPKFFDDTEGIPLEVAKPAVPALPVAEVASGATSASELPGLHSKPAIESKPSGSWLTGVLVFTTMLFAFLWIRTLVPDLIPDIIPDDGDVPSGKYVAIFYDDEAKFDKYTQEQVDAIDSSQMREFIESRADFKKIDIDQFDELGGLDPVYEQMSHEHLPKSPREVPSVVVYANGKKGMEAITDGKSLAKFLERWLK